MWIFVCILIGVLGLMFGRWFAKRKQNKDSAEIAAQRTQSDEVGLKGRGRRYREDPEEQNTPAPVAARGAEVAQSNPGLHPVFAYTLVGGGSESQRTEECGQREGAGHSRHSDNSAQGACGVGDSGGTTSTYGDSSSGTASYDSNP